MLASRWFRRLAPGPAAAALHMHHAVQPSALLLRSQRRAFCKALDPVTPSRDRMLSATVRTDLGGRSAAALREQGLVPCALLGDRLPFVHLAVQESDLVPFLQRPHYQRELLTLQVEGGETVHVLPQEVQYDSVPMAQFKVKHVNFRRWPRNPKKNPVKLAVPLIFENEEAVPTVKNGGFVMEVFSATGLKCYVSEIDHIPRFLIGDMRNHVNGDLRIDQIELPPGVRPIKHPSTEGNFLVARAQRVRG